MKKILALLLIGLLALPWAMYTPRGNYLPSDHFDGSHFFNPGEGELGKSLWDVLIWKWYSQAKPWPKALILDNEQPQLKPLQAGESPRAVFINHATVLLQWPGLNILTDPALLEGVGPLSYPWIKRHRLPGIPLDKLPKIDFILISHNHYDHLDRPSLDQLIARDQPKLIMPLGVSTYLSSQGVDLSTELDWWQRYTAPEKQLRITLVPARHWSKRTPYDTNRSLWAGFVIEKGNKTVYFAGDTGYSPHFKAIHQQFPNIDLALLPIGSYEPRHFMGPAHLNPAEAVQAARDLDAKQSIGIHFGTFRLSDEGIDAPARDLQKALKDQQWDKPFAALANGGEVRF